jgi:hypothetical protein
MVLTSSSYVQVVTIALTQTVSLSVLMEPTLLRESLPVVHVQTLMDVLTKHFLWRPKSLAQRLEVITKMRMDKWAAKSVNQDTPVQRAKQEGLLVVLATMRLANKSSALDAQLATSVQALSNHK